MECSTVMKGSNYCDWRNCKSRLRIPELHDQVMDFCLDEFGFHNRCMQLGRLTAFRGLSESIIARPREVGRGGC